MGEAHEKTGTSSPAGWKPALPASLGRDQAVWVRIAPGGGAEQLDPARVPEAAPHCNPKAERSVNSARFLKIPAVAAAAGLMVVAASAESPPELTPELKQVVGSASSPRNNAALPSHRKKMIVAADSSLSPDGKYLVAYLQVDLITQMGATVLIELADDWERPGEGASLRVTRNRRR